jgi:hypothetical protein
MDIIRIIINIGSIRITSFYLCTTLTLYFRMNVACVYVSSRIVTRYIYIYISCHLLLPFQLQSSVSFPMAETAQESILTDARAAFPSLVTANAIGWQSIYHGHCQTIPIRNATEIYIYIYDMLACVDR